MFFSFSCCVCLTQRMYCTYSGQDLVKLPSKSRYTSSRRGGGRWNMGKTDDPGRRVSPTSCDNSRRAAVEMGMSVHNP